MPAAVPRDGPFCSLRIRSIRRLARCTSAQLDDGSVRIACKRNTSSITLHFVPADRSSGGRCGSVAGVVMYASIANGAYGSACGNFTAGWEFRLRPSLNGNDSCMLSIVYIRGVTPVDVLSEQHVSTGTLDCRPPVAMNLTSYIYGRPIPVEAARSHRGAGVRCCVQVLILPRPSRLPAGNGPGRLLNGGRSSV